MRAGGGNFRSRWGGGVEYKRKGCEALLYGQGEVCQGVNGKVFPYWWSGDLCAPAKGEVDRGEAYCEMPGGVLGSEGGEGGERLWESGRGRVGVRGGAGDSEGGTAPFVSAVGDDGGEASLTVQDGGGGGEEVLRGPSLDPVPEAVHAS